MKRKIMYTVTKIVSFSFGVLVIIGVEPTAISSLMENMLIK